MLYIEDIQTLTSRGMDPNFRYLQYDLAPSDMPRLAGVIPFLSELEGVRSIPDFHVAVKVYEDGPKGKIPPHAYMWMTNTKIRTLNLSDIDNSSEPFLPQASSLRQNVICALSGILYSSKLGSDELYMAPTLDLEVFRGDKTRFDLLIQRMLDIGLSGWIIESGSSFHYYADFIMPYEKNFWQFLGHALSELIDTKDFRPEAIRNIQNAKEIGLMLQKLSSPDPKALAAIQQTIFKVFKSTHTGEVRPGLFIDPRWLGYQLNPTELGFMANTLRITNGKSHAYPTLKGRVTWKWDQYML